MERLDANQINKVKELEHQVLQIKQETLNRKVYWGKGPNMAESLDLTYADYSEYMACTFKGLQQINIRKSVQICHENDWQKGKIWGYMQYWPVYRAIRRHLRRRLLSQHQPCIKELMSLGAAYNGFKCDVRYSCLLSLAYITWRMYWEKQQNIASLSLDLPVAIDWDPPDMASKEASIGIFAHECVSSFWGFYDYAMLLVKKGTFCIETQNKADEAEIFLRN